MLARTPTFIFPETGGKSNQRSGLGRPTEAHPLQFSSVPETPGRKQAAAEGSAANHRRFAMRAAAAGNAGELRVPPPASLRAHGQAQIPGARKADKPPCESRFPN